jgi:hypothetical protein
LQSVLWVFPFLHFFAAEEAGARFFRRRCGVTVGVVLFCKEKSLVNNNQQQFIQYYYVAK